MSKNHAFNCPHCGGLSIPTEYGEACRECGIVLDTIRFLGGDKENPKGNDGFILQHHIWDARMIGTKNERPNTTQFKRINNLDEIIQRSAHIIPDYTSIRFKFKMTITDFFDFKYRVQKIGLQKMLRYRIYAIALYQMYSSKYSLKKIVQILREMGHHISITKLRREMRLKNIKIDKRDYYQEQLMKVVELFPKLESLPIPNTNNKCVFSYKKSKFTEPTYAKAYLLYILKTYYKYPIYSTLKLFQETGSMARYVYKYFGQEKFKPFMLQQQREGHLPKISYESHLTK